MFKSTTQSCFRHIKSVVPTILCNFYLKTCFCASLVCKLFSSKLVLATNNILLFPAYSWDVVNLNATLFPAFALECLRCRYLAHDGGQRAVKRCSGTEHASCLRIIIQGDCARPPSASVCGRVFTAVCANRRALYFCPRGLTHRLTVC